MRIFALTAAIIIACTGLAYGQAEPPRGMEELQAYSVFVDAYRAEDYELALTYGEWMLEAKPRTLEGYDGFSLERQFDRMVDVYAGLAEEESDPSQKEEYFQQAEGVFDEVYGTFGEDEIDLFEWRIKQGRFYHENNGDLDAGMDGAVEQYEMAYEMDPERFLAMDDGFYARVLLVNYSENGEEEKALEMIEQTEATDSVDLQNTINDVRNSIFDSPEERIGFLESRVEEAEDSSRAEMLEELVDLYEETGQQTNAAETALELYELSPGFAAAQKIAGIHLENGEYRDALGYLEEALDMAGTEEEQKQTLLQLAETYQQLEEFQAARDHARRATELDGSFGAAYMRMAEIYAATVSNCTGGNALERKDRTVYWLVLDYLDRAGNADPSLASSAESRANSYREAMPTSEDIFFSEWEKGESFTIDGSVGECYSWINETTTVR